MDSPLHLPGKPSDSGICLQAVRELGPEVPLFGVCMGLQCIGQAFGGNAATLLCCTKEEASQLFLWQTACLGYHRARPAACFPAYFRVSLLNWHLFVHEKATGYWDVLHLFF